MKKMLVVVACFATIAAACATSDGGATEASVSSDSADAPSTDAETAGTDPAVADPATEVSEPAATAAPDSDPPASTEAAPRPEVKAVGLVPLPGEQLDFTGQQIAAPSLVWSLYSGSGGVIVENVGGPMPPGCHGVSFFDPQTFELLQIDGIDAEAYATAGPEGCVNMQQDLAIGVLDGNTVRSNDEHLIQFDFGALPAPPFDVSTQIVNQDGSDGTFRAADPDQTLFVNELEPDTTHVVGVSGIFGVNQDNGKLSWLDLPATSAGPGCDGFPTLCLSERFAIDITSEEGVAATAITAGERGGRVDFGDGGGDILVSVLNGCEINQGFWVFVTTGDDLYFDVAVTDTKTGESQSYGSPIGQDNQPILDTSAFATCP